jgi:hypothetical protein
VKEDILRTPQKLFEEFIKRDSDGEFLQSSAWLNKAVMCPGYMGGPDTFYIISDKKTKALGKNKFRVTYFIEGSVTSKQSGEQTFFIFTPEKKKLDEDYRVVKTPWGWKLATPWAVSRVLVEKAVSWTEKEKSPFDQKSKELMSKLNTNSIGH